MKVIPRKNFVRFRFRTDINWTDDLSHSCPHRYFTPNFTFAFAFVILKVINSEIMLFRFALLSVSVVSKEAQLYRPTGNYYILHSENNFNVTIMSRIAELICFQFFVLSRKQKEVQLKGCGQENVMRKIGQPKNICGKDNFM